VLSFLGESFPFSGRRMPADHPAPIWVRFLWYYSVPRVLPPGFNSTSPWPPLPPPFFPSSTRFPTCVPHSFEELPFPPFQAFFPRTGVSSFISTPRRSTFASRLTKSNRTSPHFLHVGMCPPPSALEIPLPEPFPYSLAPLQTVSGSGELTFDPPPRHYNLGVTTKCIRFFEMAFLRRRSSFFKASSRSCFL